MDSSEQMNYFLNWKHSADAVAVALNCQEMLCKFLFLTLAEPDDSNPDSWDCFVTMPPRYHCVNGACKLLVMGKSRYGCIIKTWLEDDIPVEKVGYQNEETQTTANESTIKAILLQNCMCG